MKTECNLKSETFDSQGKILEISTENRNASIKRTYNVRRKEIDARRRNNLQKAECSFRITNSGKHMENQSDGHYAVYRVTNGRVID